MSDTVFTPIEHLFSSARYIDGVDKTLITKGFSKIIQGFLVAGGDEI